MQNGNVELQNVYRIKGTTDTSSITDELYTEDLDAEDFTPIHIAPNHTEQLTDGHLSARSQKVSAIRLIRYNNIRLC